MNEDYVFDKDNVRFRKDRNSFRKIVKRIVTFFLASLSIALVYYVLFALVFDTDTESRLERENEMLEAMLPELEQKEILLSDVVTNLELRDNRIYTEIFQTASPDVDPVSSLEFLHGMDTIPDERLVKATADKLEELESRSRIVEDNFRKIVALLSGEEEALPPMKMPIDNVSFAQIGASVGSRTNPFYKVPMHHNGLDIIVSSGEPIYAVASGVVSDITRSRKGLGNVVTLSHKGGYLTKYAHLADIQVEKGRSVKEGDIIGYVGTSGNSFAPHLHYEVHRDSIVLDPVSYFYATVEPREYVNMLVVSAATGQSLD
jgi:murein DD-endopeptidase MepM/ murein hydrolase activator NlpD